ncbi:MAG: LytTR family DNA-binding domain-containing protein [Bacteroidota bacterium]
MKVLIIEDEYHAAERLKKLLSAANPAIQILETIDSVEDAVSWFNSHPHPELVFMDIQLADGISFSIFEKCKIEAPVIFTTAFDEYALKAFKVNSIDYLMKPIDEDELTAALDKFQKIKSDQGSFKWLDEVIKNAGVKKYFKERFLIKKKDAYKVLMAENIAYFYSEDSLSFIIDHEGKNHIYDSTLNQIELELNPEKFFRINRKQIVHIDSIIGIHPYFNNRIKLDLHPSKNGDFIVSRDKVKAFKLWLDH